MVKEAEKRRKGFALTQINNPILKKKVDEYAEKKNISVDDILDNPEHWN